MTETLGIKACSRVRQVGAPLLLLLTLWFVWALVGDPYLIPIRASGARRDLQAGVEYKPQPPLEDALRTVQSREMFKPSVIYETKKNEAVNILGDLVFLGVIRNGESIQALVMNKKSGQSSFYTTGQALEDLEIQEIKDDKLLLKHGEEVLELVR